MELQDLVIPVVFSLAWDQFILAIFLSLSFVIGMFNPCHIFNTCSICVLWGLMENTFPTQRKIHSWFWAVEQ